jgi:hypothetical protein
MGAGGESFSVTWPDAEPRREQVPADLPMVPSYLVESLAGFMPREKDACLRFRALNEGFGSTGLPAALVCVGEEEIDHRGAKVKAWRYEQRMLGGGVAGTYWVGEDRTSVRVDWGGAVGVRAPKAEALADLHEDLKPRTAD